MTGSWRGLLVFWSLLGVICTSFGGFECLNGHNYSVAAKHETTIVGRITKVLPKGGFGYKFSVNGVSFDDNSDVCETPLAPDACFKNGPVLVYYSYQPFPNSRLEDFSVASTNSYRLGIPALAMGLPVMLVPLAAMLIFRLKHRNETDNKLGTVHVVPSE